MKDYLALTKPRITVFILLSTAIGFLCAGHFQAWTLLHALIGTGLMASGTAALNQWYEREADAKMNRTKARPIPSGRLTARRAFWFGVALSIGGFFDLWLGANLLAGLLSLFTLVSYLFVYTPLKQRSPHSTTIGAIPGAMPPLIGFAAAAGTLNPLAWILYGILFLWQFPHFYAIAWMYREDYARAGIRMLPVVEPDGESTARRIVLFSLALVPVSLLPRFFGSAGNVYLAGALALGLLFVLAGARAAFDRTRPRARQVLLASVVYLPLLYGLLVLDRPGL
ncbi:MAG TPA: heme o synthase [Bryobacteraceae bacterium]|nr:heme o synthase [Bryobacteraceae bacterium]